MGAIEELGRYLPQMTNWRRHIHANPETAFEEVETAGFIAERLRSFGVDALHEGIAKTGMVAVIRAGTSDRAIGIRADMDALDMDEGTGLAWQSRRPGKHHACGHDGHMTMLLGAAQHLARTRNFDGTVYAIFQPAEENEGGGRVMVEEGLFERFPMQAVFGMHNMPGIEAGHIAVKTGAMMASYDIFEVTITGRGGHAAMPHRTVDPIVVGTDIVQKLQTIVSRSVDPLEPAVLSLTQFHAGTTWNVIPDEAVLRGTVRAFDAGVQDQIERRVRALCAGSAAAHDASVAVHYERRYPATINSAAEAALCARVAEALVGPARLLTDFKPLMASEDFAYMLQASPGAYLWIGNGTGTEGGCGIHNPKYDFNDAILSTGAAYWVRLAETALSRQG